MKAIRVPNRWNAKSGFTLVEVMAALVGAAILALTAGVMLRYGMLSWTRGKQFVYLQEDMSLAMDIMSRSIRTGTNMSFSAGVFTVQFADKPTASVYASGNSLLYDPNTSAGGDVMTVVNGTLQFFSVTLVTNSATVALVLQGNGDLLSNQVAVARRNY